MSGLLASRTKVIPPSDDTSSIFFADVVIFVRYSYHFSFPNANLPGLNDSDWSDSPVFLYLFSPPIKHTIASLINGVLDSMISGDELAFSPPLLFWQRI